MVFLEVPIIEFDFKSQKSVGVSEGVSYGGIVNNFGDGNITRLFLSCACFGIRSIF
jgi:hypothetical protein